MLPGIAIILKVRRRKLQMSSTTETSVLNSETLFDSNFKTLITSFSNDKSGNKNFITTEILDKFNSVGIQMLQQLTVKTFSEKIEVKILGMILVKRSLKRALKRS